MNETEQQFRNRMQKVAGFMNGEDFADKNGTGLLGLCKSMRSRCEEVRRRGGRAHSQVTACVALEMFATRALANAFATRCSLFANVYS